MFKFQRFLGALNGQSKRATIMPMPGLEGPEGTARMPTGEVPLDPGGGSGAGSPFDFFGPQQPKRTKSQVHVLGAAMKPQSLL